MVWSRTRNLRVNRICFHIFMSEEHEWKHFFLKILHELNDLHIQCNDKTIQNDKRCMQYATWQYNWLMLCVKMPPLKKMDKFWSCHHKHRIYITRFSNIMHKVIEFTSQYIEQTSQDIELLNIHDKILNIHNKILH